MRGAASQDTRGQPGTRIRCTDRPPGIHPPTVSLLYGLVAVAASLVKGSGGLCTFPDPWQDHWYQTGIGDVVIDEHEISNKGVCLENRHDYYLLENLEIGCYMCLLILPRHKNVLQYKESFCVGKASLYAICDQIHMETIQKTLIREPSTAVPCPFHEAFHFSYSNNSGGFCREPASYAKPCANSAQIRLHYKHCPYAAYTYHRDVDLECLATWQEGSETYLVGRQSGKGIVGKEEKYKCFMYQILGTLIYVAMSADASCRGLRSPRNGPVVMELTQDVFGWPQPKCRFPDWVTRYSWRDLGGRHVYRPSDQGNVITALFRPELTSEGEQHKAFRCFRVLQRNTSADVFSIVSFTSHGCTSRYQCMKFVKRREGVVEVHEGPYMDYDTEPCLEAHILDSNRKLLFPESSEARHCPFAGRYQIHTGSNICTSYFRSGCNGTDVIDILSTCSSKPGLQLECLKTWREDKKRYLVATKLGETDGIANCFSFRKRGKTLHFSADPTCNKGTPYILRDVVTYVLDAEAYECDGPPGRKGVRSDNQSTQDDVSSGSSNHGGTYKHVDEPRQSRDHGSSNSMSSKSSVFVHDIFRTISCSISVIGLNLVTLNLMGR